MNDGGMKKTLVANAALLSQLIVVSAGITLTGPLFGQANQPPDTASTAKLTSNGAVTLKGQVKTDDEKKAVEDKAASLAGAGKVSNELTVGPNTSKKSE